MGCHSVVYIYSIMHVDCCEMLWLHNIIYTKHPILPSILFSLESIDVLFLHLFIKGYFSKSYLNLLKKFFFFFFLVMLIGFYIYSSIIKHLQVSLTVPNQIFLALITSGSRKVYLL